MIFLMDFSKLYNGASVGHAADGADVTPMVCDGTIRVYNAKKMT